MFKVLSHRSTLDVGVGSQLKSTGKDTAEVQELCLIVPCRRLELKFVGSTNHFLDCAEAHVGHEGTYLVGK